MSAVLSYTRLSISLSKTSSFARPEGRALRDKWWKVVLGEWEMGAFEIMGVGDRSEVEVNGDKRKGV